MFICIDLVLPSTWGRKPPSCGGQQLMQELVGVIRMLENAQP